MLASYYLIRKCKCKHEDEYVNKTLLRRSLLHNDLSKKCRVCLQDGISSIYDTEDAKAIIEALEIFCNIIVNEDDKHTKLLCTNCYTFVKQAIAFRDVALRSQKLLKESVTVSTGYEYNHNTSDDCQTKEAKCSHDAVKPEKELVLSHDKVTCKVCSKVIKSCYYNEHMTIHNPNHQGFVCEICGKSFTLRCSYYNHRVRHRTEFPFKCELCPYQARDNRNLTIHMRIHTKEYKYMCTECPARFLVKSNLNRHMRQHREPPFKCNACTKAFHTKLRLEQHHQCIHLGVRNHQCCICGKAFGTRHAVMQHQLVVHKRQKRPFGRMPSYLLAKIEITSKSESDHAESAME